MQILETQRAERPWTVSVFETLSIVLVGASLIISEGFSIGDLFWTGLYCWLILSISRKRSKIARAIFTALTAVGFIILVTATLTSSRAELAEIETWLWGAAIAMSMIYSAQIWLVWCAPTDRWLKS